MPGPTQAQVDAILDKCKKDIDALWGITSNLQEAINAALPGDTINLAAGFVDNNPIIVNKPLTIVGDGTAQLNGGVDIPADKVTFNSVNISKLQQRNDIVTITGSDSILDNVNIKGLATLGQKRGIMANGKRISLNNVRVTDIWLPDQDSQAVCGWNNMIDFYAQNCYFSAAGETFLVGGADCDNLAAQPRNVQLVSCTLTKDIKWKTTSVQVKNTLELKNVVGFIASKCIIEMSWQSAQDGYLIVLTPRNQDGNNPFACVKDVTIDSCTGGHSAVLLNMSGTDDEKPSQYLDNVLFTNNQFDDLNPATWMTSGNWWDHATASILVGNGPRNVTIDKNTLTGAHLSSNLYFYGSPKCINFNYTNNKYPKTTYGTPSAASPWSDYVSSGQFSGNSEI